MLHLFSFACSFYNKVVIKFATLLAVFGDGIFNQAPSAVGFSPQHICEDIYTRAALRVMQKTISLSSLSLDTDTFIEEASLHLSFIFFGCFVGEGVLFSTWLLQALSHISPKLTSFR